VTFFLKDQPIDENTPGRVSPISQVPTFMDAAGAQKRQMDLLTNANNVRGSREQMTRDILAGDIMVGGQVSLEDFNAFYSENGAGFDNLRPAPTSIEQAFREYGDDLTNYVIETARERAAQDPDAFSAYDLSDDFVTNSVNAELRAQFENAQQIIDMTPEDYTGEALAGGFASAMTDLRQAPALLLGLGGGGSILRVAGREALINAGLETALLPSQFEMAERLDQADPNAAQQVALAATFGAVFGGGVTAVQRGVQAYRGRQARPSNVEFEGMADPEVELLLNEVEDALLNNRPIPQADVRPMAPPQRIPSEEGPIPPRAPDAPDIPEPPDTIEEALSREVADASVGVRRKPLSDMLRDPGRVTTLENGQRQTMQIHPDSRAATELRAMGITPRTRPGLFSRNGRKNFDNLVASELEETFPGIRDAVGDDGRYLNEDGFLRFLADELNDQPVPLRANERLNAAEAQLEEYRVQKEVLTRRMSAIEDGLDIQTTQARMNEIKSHIDEGIRLSGLAEVITPRQRADMASMMAERGGSVNDLLDAMDDADLTFAERNIGEPDGRPIAPRDESDLNLIPDDAADAGELGAGQRGADGPDAQRGTEEGGTGRARQDQRQSEATTAGQQTLIDGVAPVTQRQRLEAQQTAPMRGGQMPANDGLFDVSARSQRDMFSDPGAATDMQRAIASDIRDQIATDGDFDVNMSVEGVELARASDVQKYLDDGDKFAARISLCGLG
jgi:hypothetical protein